MVGLFVSRKMRPGKLFTFPGRTSFRDIEFTDDYPMTSIEEAKG